MTMWYEIPTFPGYRLSLDDQVLSFKRGEPHVLTPSVGPKGNVFYQLRKDGKYVKRSITALHRLTFGGEAPIPPAGVGLAERTQCNNGHDFTPENIIWRKKPNGKTYRRCKTCARDAVTKFRQR